MFSTPGPDSSNLAFLSMQLYLLLSLHHGDGVFIGVLSELLPETGINILETLFEHDEPARLVFEPSKVYHALIG